MEKRSFLMVYDNQWNVPNGDPFTKEQRYDAATGKILVSDVRIKRFSRDKSIEILDDEIFYKYDEIRASKIKLNITGAAASFRNSLVKKGIIESIENANFRDVDLKELMLEFVDVRLFGGLLTESDNNISLTGAVQFKNLSSSLNKVDPYVLQNTSVFPSKTEKNGGAIGTSTIIPYSVFAVEGWLDEMTAKLNKLSEEDINKMMSTLWLGIRDKNSRSKSGQRPIVLFEIIYSEMKYKYNPKISCFKPIQEICSLVHINPFVEEKDIRSSKDYELNMDDLFKECEGSNVKAVNFFTEISSLKEELSKKPKFNFKEIY